MNDKIFRQLTPEQQDTVMKITAESIRQGINPDLVNAIAFTESNFSHFNKDGIKTSPAGARGVMQIMPDTAKLYNKKFNINIDPDDEDSNIMGGVTIIKDLLQTYKNPRNAVVLYNATPKAAKTFLETYDTDPDKAILSLPVETQRYSISVGKNFDLNDDKNTGFYSPPTGNERIVRSQDPSEESSAGDNNDETTLEKVKRIYEENKDSMVIPAAAAGAAKGLVEKIFTDPSANMMAVGEMAPEDVRVLQQRARTAEIRAQEIVDEIVNRRASGVSVADLEDEFRLRQAAATQAEQELRTATEESRRLNRAPVPIDAPVSEAVAPRTKPGASGASNWVRAMGDDIPEVLADQAANMRKDNPRGGQAIIDRDLLAKQKIADLGDANFKLATTEGGVQLQLPPQETERLNAEIANKQEVQRIQQQYAAEQAEAQRLAQERQLAQQRQIAQQRVNQAREEKIVASQQASQAKQQAAAARSQAASETRRATTADTSARAASTVAQEGAATQPSALKMMAREAGRRFSEKMPVIGNTLSAAGAAMSVGEAVDRYKQGDYSGSVLYAIEAALNAASMAPPVNPASLMVKGAGAIGSLGMIPIGIAHDYFKGVGPWAKTPTKNARGGLSTIMR